MTGPQRCSVLKLVECQPVMINRFSNEVCRAVYKHEVGTASVSAGIGVAFDNVSRRFRSWVKFTMACSNLSQRSPSSISWVHASVSSWIPNESELDRLASVKSIRRSVLDRTHLYTSVRVVSGTSQNTIVIDAGRHKAVLKTTAVSDIVRHRHREDVVDAV